MARCQSRVSRSATSGRLTPDVHLSRARVAARDSNPCPGIAGKLECGSVWINKDGMIQPNAPFGGVKQSGFGVEFGEEGLVEYTDIQVVFS